MRNLHNANSRFGLKKTRFMKKRVSVTFLLLTVFFSVFLILANLLEVKIVDLGFMTVTGGLIVFPMSYIINDCIVEVYGFRAARFLYESSLRSFDTSGDGIAGRRYLGRTRCLCGNVRQLRTDIVCKFYGNGVRLDGQRLCDEQDENRAGWATFFAACGCFDGVWRDSRLVGVFPDSVLGNPSNVDNRGIGAGTSRAENAL